jgi:hypothetical protein
MMCSLSVIGLGMRSLLGLCAVVVVEWICGMKSAGMCCVLAEAHTQRCVGERQATATTVSVSLSK